MEPLDQWIARQYRHAAAAMLASISPVQIIKERPGFGQRIVPKRGAVVASPIPASYDPDPDYFFHWYRDSAVVMDALRLLFEDGTLGARALTYFADFVRFSLSLQHLDGRKLIESAGWRAQVKDDFARFLRTDIELASIHGESVLAETRVNPDGTLDISSWARPQNDGPPSRALTWMRWMGSTRFEADLAAAVATLLRADLAFTRKHGREPCFDIWEEEKGLHYYTLCISAAALEEGASWLGTSGEPDEAQACRAEARAIYRVLDGYWLTAEGYYRSRVPDSGVRSAKELDISVILAAIHASRSARTHSSRDPQMFSTLERLVGVFDMEYPINHNRPNTRGAALGRYPDDTYYSGGAWYVSTLAAAELCFRAAAAGTRESQALVERGDTFLETVRAYTPPSGDMSEQFDKKTGAQTSAKHLAWSYAAFISCIAARRAVSG